MERHKITQALTLGERSRDMLRQGIAAKGLTQTAAAELVGLKQPNLSAILAGNRAADIETLRAIAKIAGLRIMARLETDVYR